MKVIVTGIPRSGTSMLMQMVQAGGIPLVYDNDFQLPNEHNPNGYFECRNILQSIKKAENKAIKILIPPVIKYINEGKIIWIQRNIDEVITSYKKLVSRKLDKGDNKNYWENQFKKMYEAIKNVNNILIIQHKSVMENPMEISKKISEFLEMDLDLESMSKIVDLKLYRNRIII